MKEDILNREEFVNRVFTIIESISESRIDTNVSFAIDGEWGCGKSYVLDLLERRLTVEQEEKHADEQYFVVRYNCWQYDFYDEPIIAIVAAILASIRERTRLTSEEASEKVHKAFDVAKDVLLKIGEGIVKEKLGVDVSEAVSDAKEILDNADDKSQSRDEKKHDYDDLFSFKAKLEEMKKALAKLAEEKSVVLIVDELDRCIPTYAIKVLERLHHLTEGTPKIITVLALDKYHLQSGIEKTIGIVDPEVYLRKFIQFEIGLDCGVISNQFAAKYHEYMENFAPNLIHFEESIDEYCSAIFTDIPIRMQEQIMQKVSMAHKLTVRRKMDLSFMCIELLIAVMVYQYHYPLDAFENGLKRQNFNQYYEIKYDPIDWLLDSLVITQGDYDSLKNGDRIRRIATNEEKDNLSRIYPFGKYLASHFRLLRVEMNSSSFENPKVTFTIDTRSEHRRRDERSLLEELFVLWNKIHSNNEFTLIDYRFFGIDDDYLLTREKEYLPLMKSYISMLATIR